MSITLRRQLNADEKARIIKMHGRRDFATGLPIPEDDDLQFDHIHAFADSDNKSVVKQWFKAHGLTTGYLLGASV
jgi:hypothetical protein